MTGSVALDVVIGLVFIYLLYSLLATIVQEILASNILRLRAQILKEAIRRMLDDDEEAGRTVFLSEAFYESPLVKYMSQKRRRKPSYMSARNFSKVILNILKGPEQQPGDDFRARIDDSFANGVATSPANRGETFQFLRTLWAESHGDIEKFKVGLEEWFDDTMDQASGWYKRRTQFILFFVSLVIAIIFNVDTVRIAENLSNDPVLREQIIQQADVYLKEHPHFKEDLEALKKRNPPGDSVATAEVEYKKFVDRKNELVKEASSLVKNDIKKVNETLALGWSKENKEIWYEGIPGWLITALALTLGAPFWFDLLNKLMNMRGANASAASSKGTTTTAPVAGDKKAITIKG